ncbi:MAG: hypothetical protein AB8B95_02020 [Pseudohongiellaceae bacterium]
MFKYLLFLAFSILASCASKPRIHIFSLGIEEDELDSLSQRLDEAGFDARANTLPVPPTFVEHTVIFPAITQDFTKIELITSALAEAGYDSPRLILESEANHSYSTDNIGVYLLNPDFRVNASSLITDPYSLGGEEANPLSYNYFSECPQGSESQSELNLYPAGTAIVEEFVWDEKTNNEISLIHDGEWDSDSKSVEVNLYRKGKLRYTIRRHSGSDWFGPFEALTLENNYSTVSFEACNYTYLNHLDN